MSDDILITYLTLIYDNAHWETVYLKQDDEVVINEFTGLYEYLFTFRILRRTVIEHKDITRIVKYGSYYCVKSNKIYKINFVIYKQFDDGFDRNNSNLYDAEFEEV